MNYFVLHISLKMEENNSKHHKPHFQCWKPNKKIWKKKIKSSSNKLAKEVDNSISTFNFKLVNMVKCNASNNNP